jgi:penicillin-binding protein A
MNRQIRKFGLLLVVMFAALFAQLNYLQVIQADHLANHPGNSRNAVRDFGQMRGRILTADGRVIAESYLNPDKTSKYKYLRRYPGGSLYAHLVGYFSFTYGAVGLERQYNNVLAGRTTALTIRSMSDALKSKTITADVTLTINDKLQRFAARQLRKRKGSIVIIDPRNGAILAMVSYPSFDPNAFTSTNFKSVTETFEMLNKDPNKPLLARTYRQRFPPGSTFKVITAATGLQTKVVGPQTTYPVLSALPLRFTTRPLRNFGGGSCGGVLLDVFRVSCNTSFAQMGLDIGPTKLNAGASGFGFDRKPPLDISPGAASSYFPDVNFFKRNDPQLAQGSIGQGQVAATPLQMALVAAGIANDGVIKEPHLMKSVIDSDGAVVQEETNNDWLNPISQDTAAEVKRMMIAVVDRGTGTRAAIRGVTVAAKTGTAQTSLGKNQTGKRKAHAWTIAFAPADEPRAAVVVMIENQPDEGQATGGKVAAPIVREVLTQALQRTK